MKTSTQKRIAGLTGLLLLSLLVVALAVPATQAMRYVSASVPPAPAGSGASNAVQRPTLAQLERVHGGGSQTVAVTVNAAQGQRGWAWGYYYSGAGTATLAQSQPGWTWGSYYTAAGASKLRVAAAQSQPGLAWGRYYSKLRVPVAQAGVSSGISSTTIWIVAVAAAAVLLIGGWALLRRRRQREAHRACELSPAGC